MTLLFSNLRLKLLAIFFAVALWSVVAYASNPTQSKSYPLKIENAATIPAGLVAVGDLPTVKVTVTATAENLKAFDQHTLHVFANFTKVKVGRNQVPVRVDKSDPDVQVQAPETVPVTIDELGTANETVSIERVHALPAGVHEQVNGTTITPSTVRVDGPKSQLAGSQAVVLVELDSVQQPGLNGPYNVVIRDANKKQLTTMKVTPPQVVVKMPIQADSITVAKPVGWTLTGQPAAGFRVTNVQIAPLEVQATGLQNALNFALLPTDPIDISNQRSDIVKTVSIRPPVGVEVNQRTASVHVFISPAPGVSPSPGP
jgi:YbbR domain-containing protein